MKRVSETALAEFARHLRTTNFMMILVATFLIVVSNQLPVSPIRSTIADIEKIKLLRKLVLSRSTGSEVNILRLVTDQRMDLARSQVTNLLPQLSALKNGDRALSLNWSGVLPLIEATPSSTADRGLVLQSVSQLAIHELRTFNDFKRLWNFFHRTFHAQLPVAVASKVLVLDQTEPRKSPSASTQSIQHLRSLATVPTIPLIFDDAAAIQDFNQSRFPFVPFASIVVKSYMQQLSKEYTTVLVFRASIGDSRTPTTVIVPISTQQTKIQPQAELSRLVQATWSLGSFEQSFPAIQPIMPRIGDDEIGPFDADLVRHLYPIEPQIQQQTVTLFGFAINGIQMLSWGPWLILGMQIYFYTVCSHFYAVAQTTHRTVAFPWIGLSRKFSGRALYFVSVIVVPVLSVFISTLALRYSPVWQHRFLVYLTLVAVATAIVTARLVLLSDWLKPASRITRRT